MWFKELVGFDERSPKKVRENISIDGINLHSKANGRSFQFGSLETPTLAELKEQSPPKETFEGKITVSEIVENAQELHCDSSNRNALFQVASQFNLLEMVDPSITPEEGVDRYERDHTQGPACAIACGAGTIYRNYFVPLNGEQGQSVSNQIDCLKLIGGELNNEELGLWKMNNGYALLNQNGLLNINARLSKLTDKERDQLKGKLKIGIQWNTEVTLTDTKQLVSQAYCSALPVAYSPIESIYWERFARLILEAAYEATLYAALINLNKTDCNLVYLTLLGGGAFGNDSDWIFDSLFQAIKKFNSTPLDVRIVSYRSSNSELKERISTI